VDRANLVIIGGGVVGCAIAMEAAGRHDDVFLLEGLPRLGLGASTRNSGVIHAGLYYPPGSLKARHCVAGNRRTYQFCSAHGVPHRRTGKLVVAAGEEEEEALAGLQRNAEANGVEGLRWLDAAGVRAREPHIRGSAGLEVPSSGIVSSEDLVKACARIAAERGANLLTHARVTRLEAGPGGVRVTSEAGEIEARCLVNAAGLFADEVAALLGNGEARGRYRIYPVRGEYCEVARAKSHLVHALVYPLPHQHGLSLGVHLTKTLWGTVLVGPTARYIADKNDYERDREPVEHFARGARQLLPEITAADLTLAYTGIRAKLSAPGAGPADFIVERDAAVPAAIHLAGIDSPGLTSALSLAEHVATLVDETLG